MPIANSWSSGDHYETIMGRWSRLAATEFVDWLDVAPGARWLDIGCGTGPLTEAIADAAAPSELVGIDISRPFVEFARERLGDRARIELADAGKLPLDENSMDVAVSGIVMNFLTDLVRPLAEMSRVVQPGGVAGAYVWEYGGGIGFIDTFWSIAGELDDTARDFYKGSRFAGWDAARLERLLSSIGSYVESREIVVPTVFANFDDYWEPFLGGQGPAPGYLRELPPERLAELREIIHSRLPIASDGTITFEARAWAVRCRVKH